MIYISTVLAISFFTFFVLTSFVFQLRFSQTLASLTIRPSLPRLSSLLRMPKIPPPLIDIGSNLNDPVFRAVYGGRQIHANDFEAILNRARKAGINKQILTGDCLIGSKEVIELANAHGKLLNFRFQDDF